MMRDFKGKTAFITGGASGLGLGIAKACAAEGMNVVMADLRQSVLDDAKALFEKNSWPVLALRLNVSDRAEYAKAVEEAEKKFGNIHLLVNNAGVTCAAGPLDEVTFEEVQLGINVNLIGVINGIQLILPHMLRHGEEAHIVSTASMSGILPSAKCDIYNFTKAAVVAVMESLAEDHMGGSVGFSVFCPGPHDTALGANSTAVSDILMGKDRIVAEATESNTLPDYDHSVTHSPDDAGRRVLRGIKRGDLYIFTHPEFKGGLQERFDAICRAIPDEEPNERFFAEFAFIASHPVFNTQKNVPAMDK
jgi:NAD(P)-dependent dehydrogenase (short-subunit alcohol dehydrogenase family)